MNWTVFKLFELDFRNQRLFLYRLIKVDFFSNFEQIGTREPFRKRISSRIFFSFLKILLQLQLLFASLEQLSIMGYSLDHRVTLKLNEWGLYLVLATLDSSIGYKRCLSLDQFAARKFESTGISKRDACDAMADRVEWSVNLGSTPDLSKYSLIQRAIVLPITDLKGSTVAKNKRVPSL